MQTLHVPVFKNMIGPAAAFICGIAACKFISFFPCTIALLATVIFLFLYRQRGKKTAVIILFMCISGFAYFYVRQAAVPVYTLPEEDIYIRGTVIDVPESYEGKKRFTIDDVILRDRSIPGKIRLYMVSEFLGMEAFSTPVLPGDEIYSVVKLREPLTLRNPGVYSYDAGKEGIAASGYIKQARIRNAEETLRMRLHKKRHMLAGIIDRSLSPEAAAFYKAVILGLSGGVSRETRDAFGAAGLAHLLSISGTHFGLLAFIVFTVVRTVVRCFPARILSSMSLHITASQSAVVVTLPVLVMYAMLSGARTPAIRALVMASIYMMALYMGRRGQWLNSLSIAAFVILLWQPDSLFELSFQLSFTAVLSIGCIMEKQRERTAGDPDAQYVIPEYGPAEKRGLYAAALERMKAALRMTLAAVIGTAPLTAAVFNQISLVSPMTNMVITPLVCFIFLPLGFFAGFTALVCGMYVLPLSGLIVPATDYLLQLIRAFAGLPFSAYYFHDPPVIITVLYYLSFLYFLKSPDPGSKGGAAVRSVPLILVICAYAIIPHLHGNYLKVSFLDVGQGDSSVVELPDGKVMLIDGGSDDPDRGRGVVAPYLRSRGIRVIDYLVMSHPHPDHFGGLVYILDNFHVREIWINKGASREAGTFYRKVNEHGIPYRIPVRGDAVNGVGYGIYVLHPYEEFRAWSPRGAFSVENSSSLVMKIHSPDGSVLFAGDIEEEAEENLLYMGKLLKSDVLKVPHHGGRTSSSPEFCKTVSPEAAVFSAGKNNRFRHPHADTLRRYRAAGARAYRTDTDGAVTVIFKDGQRIIKTDKDRTWKNVSGPADEMRNLGLLFQAMP